MKYKEITEAVFISRPNRFIARVNINGTVETVHVKNTGRCREILVPGTKVYLEKGTGAKRKTGWSLVAAMKNEMLINIDSQAPNRIAEEALLGGTLLSTLSITKLKREAVYGKSRLDFYFENDTRKGYIEVKGVTLERDGAAIFPDAPTDRGARHLEELIAASQDGFLCYVIFVIQLNGASSFMPNKETDPLFAAALKKASESSVNILAYDCVVNPDCIYLRNSVPIIL
jgi:sugar fermentation stimulation protein A